MNRSFFNFNFLLLHSIFVLTFFSSFLSNVYLFVFLLFFFFLVFFVVVFFFNRQILCRVIAKVLDCSLEVRKFKFHSPMSFHFCTNTFWKMYDSPCNILICMQKHSQLNNDERTQFFRKIYLSHFIRNCCERVTKGLCVRGELETEQNCNIWTPSSSGYINTSFSFSWAAQPAASPQSGAGSRWHLISKTLIPTPNWLELPVAPGYIIVWHPPASCERRICTEFNPSTVKAIPWYLRPDVPVPWLTAWSICYTLIHTSYALYNTTVILQQLWY